MDNCRVLMGGPAEASNRRTRPYCKPDANQSSALAIVIMTL